MTVIKLIILAVILVICIKNILDGISSVEKLREERRGAKDGGQTIKMTRVGNVKTRHEKDSHDEDRLIETYHAKYEYTYNGKDFNVTLHSYDMLSPYENDLVNPNTGRVLTLIEQENDKKRYILVFSVLIGIFSAIAIVSILAVITGIVQ